MTMGFSEEEFKQLQNNVNKGKGMIDEKKKIVAKRKKRNPKQEQTALFTEDVYDVRKGQTVESETYYKLISPTKVVLPRKTKKDNTVYLNLNIYRNLHYIINNNAKKEYKRLMFDQVVQLPKMKKIALVFVLNKSTMGVKDRHNVCCIVQKFFCDVLTDNELKIIPDDDDKYIEYERYVSADQLSKSDFIEIYVIDKSYTVE
jgi:hypothetical protein